MYVKLKASGILICAIFGIAHGRNVASDSSTFSCAVDEFSCRNGECIDSTSVCDGTLHCKDGSDESFPACGFLLASSDKKLSSIGVRTRRALKAVKYSSCVVPPQPKNGIRKLNRYFCDADEDCDVVEGSSLDAGSQLTYTCEPGSRLNGNSDVFCGGRGKWSPIPVCEKIKCKALTSASTSALCSLHGNLTNCEEPVLPGTKAVVSCQAGYRRDTNDAITRRDKIECKIDGEWHPKSVRCIPECGVTTDHKTPFVLNGTRATIADFPWHATLYQEVYKKEGPVKEFKCGATVIHTKLVLTAAHCVYDERTKTTKDPNTLYVATGNVFREFDSQLHDSNIVQKSPVRNVWRYCRYYGLQGNYVADIALLELRKPFTFSSILLPACLDIDGFSNQILESGSFGKVAGFGVTQSGVSSAILQTITVPYVSYSTCRNSRQGSQDEVFISDDKFCAGYINSTQAVCEGDSGGGLVFRKNNLWYVMGVVSVALGDDTRIGESTCEKFSYTLYTKVAAYIDWIQDIMYELEFSEYFSPCDLKCNPVNSESTMTSCFLSGRWTICDFPVPSQTKARIACRDGYVKSTTGQSSIECTSFGKWNPQPDVCVPMETIPTVSPTVPNVTQPVTPTIPVTSPTARPSPGIPCDTPDGKRGVCAQAVDCPSVLTELSSAIHFPDTFCGFTGAIPNFCCPLDSIKPAYHPTYPPTSASVSAPTEPTPSNGQGDFATDKPSDERRPGDGRGAIAQQKCAAYASSISPNSSTTIGNLQCANNRAPGPNQAPRDAETNEFPYMARIGFNKSEGGITWLCGATLISENYVISVAHCSQNREFGLATWVQLGNWNNKKGVEKNISQRRIAQIIRHPSFTFRVSYNDVALYKMDRPVTFDESILPACLYGEPDVDTTNPITVTGLLRDDFQSDPNSNYGLSTMSTRVVDQATCNASYPVNRRLPDGIVGESIICVRDATPMNCMTFLSGSALVLPNSDLRCMKELVGIASFGKLCNVNVPGAYMRIYHYIRWIESVVWPEV